MRNCNIIIIIIIIVIIIIIIWQFYMSGAQY